MQASTATTIHQRLEALRAAMATHQLDAWIAPSADPHLSEYLPAYWQSRQWLSGFNGSVGTLVVTATDAGLWVDSRYWAQAEEQLAGTGIRLQKLGAAQQLDHVAWLAHTLTEGAHVGVDGHVLSLAEAQRLQQAFADKNLQLQPEHDLLSEIWADRSALPIAPIYPHHPQFVSMTSHAKLAWLRQQLVSAHASGHLISALDDIAWLTNLRGSDVTFNPVFLAHFWLDADEALLFIDPSKLTAQAAQTLREAGISVRGYTEVAAHLSQQPETAAVLIDPSKMALNTLSSLPLGTTIIEAINPSTFAKSQKSGADIDHIRQAMTEDGLALCSFFAWLEQALSTGQSVTECDIDKALLQARSARPLFVSPSFATIAGFNAHGALPHYRATPESDVTIAGDGLLLIDSGGQYQNGTTDITRMVPIGQPSAEQIHDCTLVLKAHIALAQAAFPEGILSPLLDAIARAPLWAAQRDYGHGTGHGVGYFVNVHEGPQVLSYHAPCHPKTAMRAGMITSIEPGLYRPGRWGIRIENLVANVPVAQPQETEFGDYLAFDTLTLCPIDVRCFDLNLLSSSEQQWLNDYHAKVRSALQPQLHGEALAWLLKRTEAI
ncbi:MAG: aminopeptidase P family protein [Neisseriaceae bacterium]|nr:aminopeptidase P family protein [Neisseriaceae bacterium]